MIRWSFKQHLMVDQLFVPRIWGSIEMDGFLRSCSRLLGRQDAGRVYSARRCLHRCWPVGGGRRSSTVRQMWWLLSSCLCQLKSRSTRGKLIILCETSVCWRLTLVLELLQPAASTTAKPRRRSRWSFCRRHRLRDPAIVDLTLVRSE